jgi:hypothetical protein
MRIQEQYYLWCNGEQSGPFNIDQLTGIWASGSLEGSTLYWNEGSSEWRETSELNALLSPPSAVKDSQIESPPTPNQVFAQGTNLSHELVQNITISDPPPTMKASPGGTSSRKRFAVLGIFLGACIVGATFYLCCGVFVIQPIGAIPDGTTIVYWRVGTKLPFIASADSLLDESGPWSGPGVSLLGRAIVLAKMSDALKDRKIINLPYCKMLYLWSTGGKDYDQ